MLTTFSGTVGGQLRQVLLYFSFINRTVKFSAPHKAMPQLWHFTAVFHKAEPNLLVKRAFVILNAVFT
jgi:hypothetical protein